MASNVDPLQGAARNVTESEQFTVGPLPGDLSHYDKQQRCQEGISTPGYISALNGAELADSERSGIYPCADFLGSRTEPNIVDTYKAEGDYPKNYYINNNGPNGLFIVGGTSPASTGRVEPGPFVARIDPISGEQVWRTYLVNANVDNVFVGGTNLNILPDASLTAGVASSSSRWDEACVTAMRAHSRPQLARARPRRYGR